MTKEIATVHPKLDQNQVRPNADQRHRLAINGAAIHHINGDPTDNRIENLRIVYAADNWKGR